MTDIKVTCPSCSALLKLADPALAGKKIRCPKCKGVVPVPADAGSKPVSPAARAIAKTVAPPAPATKPTEEQAEPEVEKESPPLADPKPRKKKSRMGTLLAVLFVFFLIGGSGAAVGGYFAWGWYQQQQSSKPARPDTAKGYPTPDAALDAYIQSARADSTTSSQWTEGKYKRFPVEKTDEDKPFIVCVFQSGQPDIADQFRRFNFGKNSAGWMVSLGDTGDAKTLLPGKYPYAWGKTKPPDSVRDPDAGKAISLEEDTKKALAGVMLRPLLVKVASVEFTIQAPEGSFVKEEVGGGVTIIRGPTFQLHIEPGKLNLNLVKTYWGQQAKTWMGVAAERADGLIFRAVNKYKAEPTYGFVSNATLGHLDLHFGDDSLTSRSTTYTAAECLLMFHCAHTAQLKPGYQPITSLADLQRLGCRFEKEEGSGKIVGVDMEKMGCTDASLALVVKYAPDLTTLTLPATISDDGLKPLASLRQLKRLRLSVVQDSGYKDGSGFVHLEGLKNLEELALSGADLTEEMLAHLKTLTGLKELSLDHTHFMPKDLEPLKALMGLEKLSLYSSDLTDDGMKPLAGLTNLTQLSLSETKITDAGLAPLQGMTKLRTLLLAKTDVTGSGFVHLAGLTELESLNLDYTKTTDEHLKHLAGMKKLKALKLRQTPVTGTGLSALKDSPLTDLSLVDAAVTDAGLQSIGSLAQLQRLSLSGTNITDAGLEPLKGLKMIQVLDMHNTGVTENGVAEMKKALPEADVSGGK